MRILVAVIAYNEERNIGRTLQDLAAHNFGFDVVVVDNGSSDRTAEICRGMGVPVLSHCINTGKSTGTLRTYFVYADRMGYDVLCQFDGDGQHIASQLPAIVDPVRRGEADYVVGSRFLEGKGFQSSFVRRIGIRLFAFLDSVLIGRKVTDVTSGFRAYGRDVIRFFARHYRQEIVDTSQLLLLSHYAGARVLEVPVVMKEREFGQSEFNPFRSVAFVVAGLINVVGSWLQRNQVGRMIGRNRGTQD